MLRSIPATDQANHLSAGEHGCEADTARQLYATSDACLYKVDERASHPHVCIIRMDLS